MLMNNLDPEVAERPDDLIVYGGSGTRRAIWEAFDAIVATLRRLEHDETLLVQSGKPVAVFRTHPWAPRVLIANALLVPAWATWDDFRDLEDRGLTMYGQMTAGSWIYIGTQGILQGTYETLAELARRHFGGTLSGRLVVTAGLGGMGGAQPLAVTMNGGIALVVEVDPDADRAPAGDALRGRARPLARRRRSRGSSSAGAAGERAVHRARRQRRRRAARARARAASRPTSLTDQTSAHDALNGYVPNGLSLADADALRRANPTEYVRRSIAAMAAHVRAMLDLQARGAVDVRLRQQHPRPGRKSRRHRRVSRSPASSRSTSVRSSAAARVRSAGRRCRAIPADIAATDRLALEMFAARRAAVPLDPPGGGARRVPGAARRASSGSATASAPDSAWRSTTWSAAASSRRPS